MGEIAFRLQAKTLWSQLLRETLTVPMKTKDLYSNWVVLAPKFCMKSWGLMFGTLNQSDRVGDNKLVRCLLHICSVYRYRVVIGAPLLKKRRSKLSVTAPTRVKVSLKITRERPSIKQVWIEHPCMRESVIRGPSRRSVEKLESATCGRLKRHEE